MGEKVACTKIKTANDLYYWIFSHKCSLGQVDVKMSKSNRQGVLLQNADCNRESEDFRDLLRSTIWNNHHNNSNLSVLISSVVA